jgi:surfeit locus 1 family protein
MKRLVVPTVSTILMLAVLIGLGTWQMQRRAWKADLLARIDAAETQAAAPLRDNPPDFAKVRIEGTLQTDRIVRYGAEVRADTLGAHIIVPMLREHADPVLVDLGWAPNQLRAPLAFPAGPIEGFIRPPEHAGAFSAKDDPAQRLFYTLDPAPIAAAIGLAKVAPFTLVAMGAVPLGSFPQPVQSLPRPPDNHLQYALTWYGFALTLLIIFALYARKSLRT